MRCCPGASGLVLHSARSLPPLATGMLVACGVSVTAHASAAEVLAQSLNLFFQQCGSHQYPLVGISGHSQGFLAGILFIAHEPSTIGIILGIELSLWVKPRDISWALTQFCPSSVEGCLHQRHSLIESKMSWQRYAFVSSLQLALPGSHHS